MCYILKKVSHLLKKVLDEQDKQTRKSAQKFLDLVEFAYMGS